VDYTLEVVALLARCYCSKVVLTDPTGHLEEVVESTWVQGVLLLVDLNNIQELD
jgi:hypothetical protein